ncbi:hypothetical protein EYE40_07410 [Glaciihabitans arcticus]|uniref:Pilus assembly protein n=1 Tax=Glaciihabitans arcticus TaxID=2668039 RepID=A0A4V2JEX2_9MICO|nr:hypothetical protein [Glaciihabitans arcticus]TBN57239.1 hypothetical protein EYE40_07410 [Glaciihabitans arcticus]
MRRSRLWDSDETGSSSLEFVTTGMILLVPLVYLVLTVSAIQAGALAIEGAARQAARVYVQAPTTAEAKADATRAIEFGLADYGIDARKAKVAISCAPKPRDCLTRRGFVTVSIAVAVPLPLVPPSLSLDLPFAVQLESSATQQVSRFWGAP